LERDHVIQVGRLHGIEKFEGEIENFIPNTFINFKPVKRFEYRSGVKSFAAIGRRSSELSRRKKRKQERKRSISSKA